MSDEAIVTFNDNTNEALMLRVVDVLGKERIAIKSVNSGKLAIDMKSLPSGTYFMKSDWGESQSVHIIVKK